MSKNHQALIEEYIQKKCEVLTEANFHDLNQALTNYYTWIENNPFDKKQIFTIKVETTDRSLKDLNLPSTFYNRVEFAQWFFIYEPKNDHCDYIEWLEFEYTEAKQDIVKKVHQYYADSIINIIENLKIVDRNIGIKYSKTLKEVIDELAQYADENYK